MLPSRAAQAVAMVKTNGVLVEWLSAIYAIEKSLASSPKMSRANASPAPPNITNTGTRTGPTGASAPNDLTARPMRAMEAPSAATMAA